MFTGQGWLDIYRRYISLIYIYLIYIRYFRSKISDIFDIFDIFENITIFSNPVTGYIEFMFSKILFAGWYRCVTGQLFNGRDGSWAVANDPLSRVMGRHSQMNGRRCQL